MTKLNPKGLHKVLLKVQDRDWAKGSIFVYYDAKERKVGIKTYRPGSGWSFLATWSKTLQDGDRLAGQALADGTVKVFVNGTLVGQANAGSFFADKGGYIGLWFVNVDSPQANLDDFKGNSLNSISTAAIPDSSTGEKRIYLPIVIKD